MRRRVADMEHELDEFRRKQSALDQALNKMVAFDAAMRVLFRNNLLLEWADEIQRVPAPSPPTGQRQ